MEWQWTPYTIPLIVAAAISAISALYMWWRHRHLPWAKTGMLLILACAVWTLGYALELRSVNLSTKVFWAKVQYVGVIAPTVWLIFMLQYTDREKWLTRRNLTLLSIVPLITLLLVFTNEAHGLIWSHAVLNIDGPLSVLEHRYNVGFWVFLVYEYILGLLGSILFVQMLIRSRHLYRWQAIALLFAVFIPFLGTTLQLSSFNPFPCLKLAPLTFTVSSLILGWSLFRLQLGDIVRVGREVVIEGMSDGIMVLDFQNRIVDLNPAAQQLIGHTISELIGQPVGQVWPEWSSQMEYDERGKEVVLDKGDGQRTYDVRISSLVDWRGQIISRVVVLRDITERKQAEEELKQSFEKLQRIFEGTVHALASAVEMRDPYTAGHQRRVANLACAIAKEMGLSEEQISGLRMAGLIHDIGKISVPVQILSKRGGLNDLEFDMIKTHPQVGHDILKTIEFPWPVAQIVLQHHERMDGSGYPAGLSGEGILMEARILSVADVVEAMASHRPYRSALGVDKALEEISQNRGVLYDPEVVDACLKLFTEKGFTFE